MDSTEYNPEKKAMPVTGLVLMILGLMCFIAFIIADWFLKVIPLDGLNWVLLIGVVVIVAVGAVLVEIAKKKKYGSRKLFRVADMLSWGFLIALVIGIILKFFIHT